MAKVKTVIELQENKWVQNKWRVIIIDENSNWDRECETPKVFDGQLIADMFDFDYMKDLAHFFTAYGKRKVLEIDIDKDDKVIRVEI